MVGNCKYFEYDAFNRTIVELKFLCLYFAKYQINPFNRTIVELKFLTFSQLIYFWHC